MALAMWLGWVVDKARRQGEAVGLLEQWGGHVDYEHEWQGPFKPPKKGAAPGWPWLRRLLGPRYGPDFFDKVIRVELVAPGRRFTTADGAAARRGGTAPLPSSLLVLTDRDLAALGSLPDLKLLHISADLSATRSGLRRLSRLRKLETLIFDNTSGRSTGGVTDATLAVVERMPYLTSLHLEGNHITDAGLASIRWPAGLIDLNLSGTRITDRGMEHLKTITSLRTLAVLDTRVTPAGVAELQKALPKCQVRRSPW